MGDDLVAEEIEVDPFIRAAAFGAAEQAAVEVARGGEIVDRKGEVEGRQQSGFLAANPAERERKLAAGRSAGAPLRLVGSGGT